MPAYLEGLQLYQIQASAHDFVRSAFTPTIAPLRYTHQAGKAARNAPGRQNLSRSTRSPVTAGSSSQPTSSNIKEDSSNSSARNLKKLRSNMVSKWQSTGTSLCPNPKPYSYINIKDSIRRGKPLKDEPGYAVKGHHKEHVLNPVRYQDPFLRRKYGGKRYSICGKYCRCEMKHYPK